MGDFKWAVAPVIRASVRQRELTWGVWSSSALLGKGRQNPYACCCPMVAILFRTKLWDRRSGPTLGRIEHYIRRESCLWYSSMAGAVDRLELRYGLWRSGW